MPEMCLIGYVFDSREDILPYCEPVTQEWEQVTDAMPTLNFCMDVSSRYDAWVACGFAEKATDDKLYNSQLLVNSAQQKIHLSRKTLLYEDDLKWADVSPTAPKFNVFDLYFPRLDRTVKVGTGVCMDINWKDFEEGKHE